jgi:hypothetical protein
MQGHWSECCCFSAAGFLLQLCNRMAAVSCNAAAAVAAVLLLAEMLFLLC